ncbi:MAG: hypothetical protein PVTTEEND_000849, partial [Candidatus Fervidibacter sp.]
MSAIRLLATTEDGSDWQIATGKLLEWLTATAEKGGRAGGRQH